MTKHETAEEITRSLLAKIEYVEHDGNGRSGTFAHVTVDGVTSIGFNTMYALHGVLALAKQINDLGLSIADFDEQGSFITENH